MSRRPHTDLGAWAGLLLVGAFVLILVLGSYFYPAPFDAHSARVSGCLHGATSAPEGSERRAVALRACESQVTAREQEGVRP